MAAGIAAELAKKQKEISVAEFFERNKHILGFDSMTKSIITGVKEAVDNALDACEEAEILPEIYVQIDALGDNEYRLVVEDNGPGIMRRQVPNVFGRLLYGSRFHTIRQTRGQQGIGISAVVMYGQLTTGKPAIIRSKVAGEDVAHEFELFLNTKMNRPEKIREEPIVWSGKEHGTRIEVCLKGRVTRGKQSVAEYLRGTAIVNPHATISYKDPFGGTLFFQRSTTIVPPKTREIKPHPHGIELGMLMKMLKSTKARKLSGFLSTEFSSVSAARAKQICEKAGLDPDANPKRLSLEEVKGLLAAFSQTRLRSPDTSCLSPIGARLIKLSLKNVLGDLRPEFYAPPVTRSPKVYSGNPFQVEAGIVYGGDLRSDSPVEILRFANRVPLMYQQGACAITRAIEDIDWRPYGLDQKGGRGIPHGPAIIMVHIASTKIPFTSEAKEAVANVEEITEEVKLALRECARKLRLHLSKEKRRSKVREKFDIAQRLLPEIARKSAEILDRPVPDVTPIMTKVMDVVEVSEKLEYHKKTRTVESVITIRNYRPKSQSIQFYAVIPPEYVGAESLDPPPKRKRKGGRYMWEFKRLPSNESRTIKLLLRGVEPGEYDETEFYVEGVDPLHLLGAEPLPGDWDLDGLDTTLEDFSRGKRPQPPKPPRADEEDGPAGNTTGGRAKAGGGAG
ncbi:MAG: DNA topoisomerase VI subunit B [Thermoplasmata archaeon]|nr:DNA topoisomerase VI subunit B [Thermoplasmata archaeon]